MVDAKDVMDLRKSTGAGVNDCKKALTEAAGDVEKAKELLRKWGGKIAEKKATRATGAGLVGCYLHPTPGTARVGVMVQFNCETDFVARTDEFKTLVNDLALQIAATSPLALTREEVDEAAIAKEKEVYRSQALEAGRPEKVIDKIVDGKLEKFFEEVCLMEQVFVKDQERRIEDVVKEASGKVGENIVIRRFTRFQLGESS